MDYLKQSDLRTDEQLKESGFTADDTAVYKNLTGNYFTMLVDYDQAVVAKDYSTQLDIEAVKPIREAELLAYGLNPKQVPLATLKTLAHAPQGVMGDDPIIQKYKERINSPATGIRAFCVTCQGGSTTGVAECAVTNCPLYFFRMGNNPLFGRVLPPVNFIEIEGDDVGDINEGEDAGDAD